MFEVSVHSIERYITRVLGIECDQEELEDMVEDMGGEIAKTINNMITNHDFVVREDKKNNNNASEGYLYLYRNIVIIANNFRDTGMKVVTVYNVPQNYMSDIQEYIDTINFIKNKVLKLQEEIIKLDFKKKSKELKQVLLNRIDQYSSLLFYNPLGKLKGELVECQE